MEEIILIASLVVALSIILLIILIIRKKRIREKVLSSSMKIAKLIALNQEIFFHDIQERFFIEKYYDNKKNYYKIQPGFIMLAEIRERMGFFSVYVSKMKENRSNYSFYQKQIETIMNMESSIDYTELRLSRRTYERYEKKLFHERVLSPVVDCFFRVDMSYSSPKRKVNLIKSEVFDFNELFACFESVSRSRLDGKTFSRLIKVERGEISDSLRYDILNRDKFQCVICGASQRLGARLHIDHIIPVSKGGKSTPDNLRTLCERCNIGKSNKIETASSQTEDTALQEVVCERCGAKMILRKGKYGEFYGCSTFPRCRFIKEL